MALDRQCIFLVEDDEEDVRLLRIAFEEIGAPCDFHVAPSLKEASRFIRAVDKGRKPVPDLAMLDIKLLDGDGIEALRRIRASSKMSHVPCFMLTSSNHPGDVADSQMGGATRYLVKPMGPSAMEALATEIHEIWRAQTMRAP